MAYLRLFKSLSIHWDDISGRSGSPVPDGTFAPRRGFESSGVSRVTAGWLASWFCSGLRPDRSLGRTINFVHYLLIFLLPVMNSAEPTSLVTRLDEFFRGALRAPPRPSIEDKLNIFWDVFHPLVKLGHGDVDCAGNGAVLF